MRCDVTVIVAVLHMAGKMAELQAGSQRSRTFNMTVLYPPTMTGEYEVRLASWTPAVDMFHEESCTLYEIRAPGEDQFGCDSPDGSLGVAPHLLEIAKTSGHVSSELEKMSPWACFCSKRPSEGPSRFAPKAPLCSREASAPLSRKPGWPLVEALI